MPAPRWSGSPTGTGGWGGGGARAPSGKDAQRKEAVEDVQGREGGGGFGRDKGVVSVFLWRGGRADRNHQN